MDIQNAYATLGLREGAGEDEIKAAYRALAQKYSPENYEASPLREDAEQKMTEINEAFDLLMSQLRTGAEPAGAEQAPPQGPSYGQGPAYDQGPRPAYQQGGASTPQYRAIRQLINGGQVEQALAQLNAIPNGSADAEWNFLMGSAYYYKGWVTQALGYFQRACQLAPENAEYAAALRNLQNNANGAMPGNPYGNQNAYGAQAVGCSCCDMCTAMMCMDMCCGCGRGGC